MNSNSNETELIKKFLTKEQKQFMRQMRNRPSLICTEYVLALLYKKDNNKAEALQKQFEKCAKKNTHMHVILKLSEN